MPKKMNREELSQLVAEKITEALPKEFIDECIVEGIEKAILDFKVESYTLANILKEIVTERAKEILKTKYKTMIEQQAENWAQQALASVKR
jgi:hypothetical protein